MKRFYTRSKAACFILFVVFSGTLSMQAQNNNVGIGTATPDASALLDVSSTTKGLLTPRMTLVQRDAISAPVAGLLIYQTDNTPGYYYHNGTTWTNLSAQLEKITKNSKTGHRILGRDAANYGDIGTSAVDLSVSTSASTTKGATGDYAVAIGANTTASSTHSTAMGVGTIASGYASTSIGAHNTASGAHATAMGYKNTSSGEYVTSIGAYNVSSGFLSTTIGGFLTAPSRAEVAVGTYNTNYTPTSDVLFNTADRAFGVGIGTGTGSNAKDGLIVYKDGTLAFNKLTAAPTITTDRFYILNDKLNYNGAEIVTSQLEKVTESGKTGHRIFGRDPANYGNIGSNAVDLSVSSTASSTKGATGPGATAMGFGTTASGGGSTTMGASTTASGSAATAMGNSTTASGDYSAAMGYSTTASGAYATAMGYYTTAQSHGETAVGSYNTSYTPSSIYFLRAADRAFGVGIGNGSSDTKDGLIVYKSGNTFISNEGIPANVPDGTTSIFTGTTNTAALQVRSSANGVNIRTPNANTGISIAKATTPTATTETYMSFGHLNSGSYVQIGAVAATAAGTGVTYNTTSDRRLKIDNGTYSKGLTTLNQIKIHDYTWKETKSKDVGVFAQELYKVYPSAVLKGDNKAENDPTKIEQRWQVDYSKLVPVLVAATQELSAKNDALTAKNEQLARENAALKAQMTGFADRLGSIEKALNSSTKNIDNTTATSTKK